MSCAPSRLQSSNASPRSNRMPRRTHDARTERKASATKQESFSLGKENGRACVEDTCPPVHINLNQLRNLRRLTPHLYLASLNGGVHKSEIENEAAGLTLTSTGC